jgi:hypothetical protein
VVGTGAVTFSLWARLLRNIRVRVMQTLPSGILIGRRLMLRLKMSLDFSSGMGSFSADTPCGPRIFSWCILHDRSGVLEQVEVINEEDLEDSIRELDLQGLATRRHRRLFARCCYATGTCSQQRRRLRLVLSSDWTLWRGRT